MRTQRRFLLTVFQIAMLSLLLLCLADPGLVVVQAAGPRYVDTGGSDISNDCSSGGSPCRTVQHAVDQASSGDDVRVAAGAYTGVNTYGGLSQVVYITKSVTIRGGYTTTNWTNSYPVTQPTTLDAEGSGRVVYVTDTVNVTLENLRITGGDAAGLGGDPGGDTGGGIYTYSATLTIRNSEIYNNTAVLGGGGALYAGGAATLADNSFTSNTADNWAGALYLYRNGASISGSSFSQNSTGTGHPSAAGGALLLNESPANFSNNYIFANSSKTGGGLSLYASSSTFNANHIFSNTATDGSGGGLIVGTSSNVILTYNEISTNTARWGGAIDIPNCQSVSLTHNNFFSNTATDSGGAVSIYQSNGVTLTSNTISRNSAATSGGGINGAESSIFLSDNTVSDNESVHNGGGYCFGESQVSIDNDTIKYNTTDGAGGGVRSGSGSVITLTNSSVQDNTAAGDEGGGIAVYDGTTSRITDCDISDNHQGGGIFNNESYMTIDGGRITGNDSDVSGGGILSVGYSTLAVRQVVIQDNISGGEGGGIRAGGDTEVQLENDIIAGNQAAGCGTGVKIRKGTAKNITVADNSSTSGDCPVAFHIDFADLSGLYFTGTNSIFWGNADTDFQVDNDANSTYAVTYSDIEDGFVAGTGNISSDPLFENAGSRDYHLQATSPCIDTGTGAGMPVVDIDNDTRPQDGNGSGTAEWDMGAYEAEQAESSFYSYLPIVMK